jgi:hypothetical protein
VADESGKEESSVFIFAGFVAWETAPPCETFQGKPRRSPDLALTQIKRHRRGETGGR